MTVHLCFSHTWLNQDCEWENSRKCQVCFSGIYCMKIVLSEKQESRATSTSQASL